MGVHGLTALLDQHQRIYRDVRFRESRLLVDGCNLIYMLYFHSGLDQNHGGEYAKFEVVIEKFFKALRECRISVYVVLDGGSDHTDKKLKTLTQKAKSRIKNAHRAAQGNRPQHILPQLVKLVFKQTLVRLGVPLAQCYEEADREIAGLARDWRCPVLSNDSDFYIFDLPAGLLPLSSFRWKAMGRNGSQRYIPCKKYTASSFCTFFSVQQQLLPVFATLAGNDYVKTGSIGWDQFAPDSSEPTSRLEGLLCWLGGFSRPQEAIEAALGLMGNLRSERKAELLKDLYLGMEEYQLPPCSLNQFFLHRKAPPLPAEVAGHVPDWIRLPLTRAQLSQDLLDVLLLQRMPLSFPVSPAHLPSAHLVSRTLRQVTYGLLLGAGRQVMERDRDGLELTFIPVQPAFTETSRQLLLPHLDQAEPSQRLQVLLEALQVTEDSLSRLPPQLRLPVAVTCYWLQSAEPPPEKELLEALLLGLSTGLPLRPRAGKYPSDPPSSSAPPETRSRTMVCVCVAAFRGRRQLDVGVVHAFNQWQSCLKVGIELNQLLGFPLPEPQISRLYEGTLIHQLVHQMRSGEELRPFGTSVKLYQCFQDVVQQFHTREETPSGTKEVSSGTQKEASSGTKEASSGTKEASSGTQKEASSGTWNEASSGTQKKTSSGTQKEASPRTQKKTSCGTQKKASSETQQRHRSLDDVTPGLRQLSLLNKETATEDGSSVSVQEDL
ncbi:single-strand DNA endonuclease ASTE1 [Clinocottus analis]|uniref:single-strand DNA endonuclease ASTE1 n=1 Tax=Clinocottus analis TaxID=304258 RepID=UPI0035C0D872